jgi:hypothetical protein
MKFPLVTIILIFSAALIAEVQAQSKEPVNPADKNFPTTLQPVNPVKYYGPRKAKKKKKTVTYDAQNEYYERIENTWREREKREKTFERREATDYMKPPYFGHKKPPKIRPLEKRRYCKICGIRH